jgi:Concanavalin A-like lectin/glucanases superfamily
MRKPLLAMLVLCLLSVPALQAESLNFALALRWQSHAATDLQFSEFINQDHTVAFRFMPQYTMTTEGAVLSVNGSGTYVVGIGGYRANGSNAVKLVVRVGSSSAYYSFGNPAHDGDKIPLEKQWHTLAVVRKGSSFRLFLNGKHREKDGGGDLQPSAADIAALQGKLEIGSEPLNTNAQSFGLVDDLAVFGKALSEDEIATLFSQPRLHKSIEDLDLIRAWTFDDVFPSGDPLSGKFNHDVTLRGSAYIALVTQARQNDIDVDFLPPPFKKAKFRLPFEPGQIWKVEQPYEGLASHNDYAAFSLDMVRADLDKTLDNSVTCGTKVFVAADSLITEGCDLGDPQIHNGVPDIAKSCYQSLQSFEQDGPGIDGSDFVQMQVADGEFNTYWHVQKGSLREAFPDHPDQFHSPSVNGPPPDIHVKQGRWLARAGTEHPDNCHLHFSTGDNGATYPISFEEYDVRNPGDKEWLRTTGAPLFNQFVRIPPEPKPAPAPPPGECAAAKAKLAEDIASRKLFWADIQNPNTDAGKRHFDAQQALTLTEEIDELTGQVANCK